jgi:alpha-glucuronidase
MFKKIGALLISTAIILAMTSFVYASEKISLHPVNEVVNHELIVGEATKVGITPYITSSGTFTFDLYNSLISDSFTITNTSIKITANATTSTSSKTYFITLHGPGCGLGSTVKYIADGSNYQYTWTGLTNGGTYYFVIETDVNTGRINGSGSITNFGHVV